MNEERVAQLQQLIETRPDDPFPRYGLALEYRNAGRTAEAVLRFCDLVDHYPDYLPAYLHCGLLLEESGDVEKAAAVLRSGIELADRRHDARTRAELAAALSMLND